MRYILGGDALTCILHRYDNLLVHQANADGKTSLLVRKFYTVVNEITLEIKTEGNVEVTQSGKTVTYASKDGVAYVNVAPNLKAIIKIG